MKKDFKIAGKILVNNRSKKLIRAQGHSKCQIRQAIDRRQLINDYYTINYQYSPNKHKYEAETFTNREKFQKNCESF